MRSRNVTCLTGLALGALFLFPWPAAALDPEKLVTQYTRDGYLWIGTQEGLVRFDGVRFTVFDQKNVPALRSADVLALCAGADGSLWIGTRHGGVIRLRDGVFTAFTQREGLPNDVVRCLYEDSRGRLWVGTEGGLVRFDEGRFVAPRGSKSSNSPDMVLAIAESGEDLWFATGGGGIRRLRGSEIQSFTSKDGLTSDFVRCLYADRDSTLWIGTRGGGFGKLR